MNIEVGKFYKTRSGAKAGIYTTTARGPRPIQGFIATSTTDHPTSWSLEGFWILDIRQYIANDDDLIAEWTEPTVPRYAYVDRRTHQLYLFPNLIGENETGANLIQRVPHLDKPGEIE